MASSVLEILQKRVQTLADNVLRTEADIQHTQVLLQQQQALLSQAEQSGNLEAVRAALTEMQDLQARLPKLEQSLAKLQHSQRLFARQLAQQQPELETA
ncbi:hypothetical protein LVJ82_14270 [Vitreoscilla massiliensis]|uniref:Uncharacterized protein n=1 Tax=Vitreoscilla massiliensis TaxID=1689272 RepID=A0ABY4DZC9_9NEIS|nr:hypothetical protein [Vitreoscilla massiliensis]UOO88619.1 hypothetical protein LVJ82_14270 [Vitreoscilla massiliensis]